jgi:hypothetical protein
MLGVLPMLAISVLAHTQEAAVVTQLRAQVYRTFTQAIFYGTDGTTAASIYNQTLNTPEAGSCIPVSNTSWFNGVITTSGNHVPFTETWSCGRVVINVAGQAYYARGSGRTGAGIRYSVNSGTKTVN